MWSAGPTVLDQLLCPDLTTVSEVFAVIYCRFLGNFGHKCRETEKRKKKKLLKCLQQRCDVCEHTDASEFMSSEKPEHFGPELQ